MTNSVWQSEDLSTLSENKMGFVIANVWRKRKTDDLSFRRCHRAEQEMSEWLQLHCIYLVQPETCEECPV